MLTYFIPLPSSTPASYYILNISLPFPIYPSLGVFKPFPTSVFTFIAQYLLLSREAHQAIHPHRNYHLILLSF